MENMLYLGLLSGPNKVKLHKINYYLSPIVDKLLEFWNEVKLLVMYDHSTERNIKLVVICYSNNISVARKLCSHISALTACHQYYKKANTNGRKLNFKRFNNMPD